jgi:RND family efflux transporter MFP subunit
MSQFLMVLAAIALLAGAGILIQYKIRVQAALPAPVKSKETQIPDVSVVTVHSGNYTATVTAHGAASPHFELKLTAQVSGQVETLEEVFETGRRLEKGALMARLDDSAYKASVASARKDLADARLLMLEEKRKGLQVKAEWASSGISGKPDSELVLRKPQHDAAQAAVADAEAALASALKNLQQTKITAPFDALVVKRLIAPGSYLQAGTEIATLYGTDRLEMAVSFSADDWDKLPDAKHLESGEWPAALTNVENGQCWTGRVLRTEQHLEQSTRQRTLILAVDNPLDASPPLLPETFLLATITGRTIGNLWKLPSSALSQKGEIWHVTDDGTLDRFSARAKFSDAENVYIAAPDHLTDGPHKVLVHPLSGYLQGMTVNPVEVGHE